MSRSLGLLEKLGGKKGDKKGGAGALAADLSLAALLVAGLAVAVGLFISRAWEVGAVNEDAFISFRYAQNLLAGGGLVFNPDGQRVEGITNLLWTFSGAGLPTVSVTLGLACGVLILAWA